MVGNVRSPAPRPRRALSALLLLAAARPSLALAGYERLTWTTQAKLKEFKRQYVEHAARKLRLIVDMTSANCSHQVQQELSSTFARLCHMVDESTTEMKDLERQMERSIKELEEVASRSKVLKNQSTFLSNKLELFEASYLKTD